MSEFLGIAREPVFSPGKVDADRAILAAVADALVRRGHRVRVVSAEESLAPPSRGTTVFTMSQGPCALATLRAWEDAGLRVVNRVSAILGCHRHRLRERLARAGVPTPETLVLDGDPPTAWPSWLGAEGGWLKRGDVHATEPDDVVAVHSPAAAREAMARMRARGIGRVALQRHVEGPVCKFYGTASGFLATFSPDSAALALHAEQVAALRRVVTSAARAVGLEVYGGDCVLGPAAGVALIDLNDWPSYRPCRAAAAEAIADHLETPGGAGGQR